MEFIKRDAFLTNIALHKKLLCNETMADIALNVEEPGKSLKSFFTKYLESSKNQNIQAWNRFQSFVLIC